MRVMRREWEDGPGTKKEAAQLTPDCTASNLKAGSWCPDVFTGEYQPSHRKVPNRGVFLSLFDNCNAMVPGPDGRIGCRMRAVRQQMGLHPAFNLRYPCIFRRRNRPKRPNIKDSVPWTRARRRLGVGVGSREEMGGLVENAGCVPPCFPSMSFASRRKGAGPMSTSRGAGSSPGACYGNALPQQNPSCPPSLATLGTCFRAFLHSDAKTVQSHR